MGFIRKQPVAPPARRGRWRWVALASLWMNAGCAAIPPAVHHESPKLPRAKLTADESAAPFALDQQESAILKFEQRRDAAQLGAALDRWKLGDAAGCQALLEALLARNPVHRGARAALADLHAAQDKPEAALAQLHELLKLDPADSQTHHSLGLLLESLDRPADAKRHFSEACRLDPANQLFALSLEACGSN